MTANSSETRVLKAIRTGGPISRRDLPARTGLSAGTITQITSDLLRRGFIAERKAELGQTGRPRVFLEIRQDGPIVLGATMSEDGVLRMAFVDLAGRVRFATELETGIGIASSLDDLVDAVTTTLETAIAASGCDRNTIDRVGISLPALIDSNRGVIHFMATFPQTPFPFAEAVARRIGLNVTAENHMSCLARAELWFGSARGLDTFTLVHIGSAIGSAQYFAGVPRTGAHGINPQIAHIKTAHGPDALPCYCGANGCATAYASMHGMAQRAGLVDGFDTPSAELARRFTHLVDAAEAGDPRMLAAIDAAATHLALLVTDLVIATDPGDVLVTVPDARCIAMMRERFDEVFRRNVVPGTESLTRIRFAVASENWESTGAAALALEQVTASAGRDFSASAG